ncbi:MAG: flagellar biosynthesis anti-sigma factor FlgM [Erythrobacter sp.]|jgi:negative regulator of flagellin synthesis FlgM|nr:flagellar biosynthesis anti-sigma factor FlgM [Erythrobacter sp.]
MPSFELNKLQQISAARGLSESDRTQIGGSRAGRPPAGAAGVARPGVAIEVNAALDPSQPPVAADRVAEIRKALEEGTYPLVPTKIADAIIAARVGFGVERK